MAITRATVLPMPDALVHYWTMWNEPDLDAIRGHLEKAVSESVLWSDPLHRHRGRDALEENVRTLRADKPQYRFVIGSEIDGHNDRLRYQWRMVRKHRVLMVGYDIVTLDETGLIGRVDGFFGDPLPLAGDSSGVPARLRADD